jgi:hypothetical protein
MEDMESTLVKELGSCVVYANEREIGTTNTRCTSHSYGGENVSCGAKWRTGQTQLRDLELAQHVPEGFSALHE